MSELQMTRVELELLWTNIRRHFAAATALLPVVPRVGEEGGTIEAYREWLEHNELGLALDELEMLGEANGVVDEYWLELASAARLMRRDAVEARCRARIRPTAR